MPEEQSRSMAATAIQSFVNLGHFALGPSQAITMPPWEDWDEFGMPCKRRLLNDSAGAVQIGAIRLQTGEGVVDYQRADEFILVCEGSLILQKDGREVVLLAGDSVVLGHGCYYSLEALGPASLVFFRYTNSKPDKCLVVQTSHPREMPVSPGPAADLLIGAPPRCRSHTDHQSIDQVFTSGTWSSTPYQRHAMRYGYYELMYILKGSVTLEDEHGCRATFSQGDIVVIRQGAKCSWDSREDVEKVFVLCSS